MRATERQKLAMKQYYLINRERALLRSRSRYQKKREEIISSVGRYQKELYLRSEQYRLVKITRRRLNHLLERGALKGRALQDVGCSVLELKIYLEGKFKKGMTWKNRGMWHVDHVTPLGFFDLTDPKQFSKASHYTNLQPLWAHENYYKNRKNI